MANLRSCPACKEPNLVWGRAGEKKANGDWLYKYYPSLSVSEAEGLGDAYKLPPGTTSHGPQYFSHERVNGGFVPDYASGPHICDWAGNGQNDLSKALRALRLLKGVSMNMKPSQIKEAIKVCYAAKVVPIIWGPPACGKTQVVNQAGREIAESLGLKFGSEFRVYDPHVTSQDSCDARGIPAQANGKTTWLPPESFPTEGAGIFYLDEFMLAPQSVQNVYLQMLLGGTCGTVKLGDGWLPVITGNRVQDRAGAKALPTTIESRGAHFEFVPDIEDWTAWAFRAGIDPAIVGFLRFRPNLLMHEPKDTAHARPAPRTWELADKVYKQTQDKVMLYAIIEGIVGQGAAAEFLAFVETYRRLPNLDHIILSPDKATLPTDPATRYATAVGLANKATSANFGAIITYLNRMPQEFNVLAVKAATSRDVSLASTAAFSAWGAANASRIVS